VVEDVRRNGGERYLQGGWSARLLGQRRDQRYGRGLYARILGGVKMFWNKKTFMDWDDYKNRIDFLDVFHFQQKCRREALANI